MRLCVLWFLAGAVLAAAGPACERRAAPPGEPREAPQPAQATAPGSASAGETAPERPAGAQEGERRSVRRGDRHARAEARRDPGVKRVTGTVARAGGRSVAIRSAGAPPLTLRVAPGTAITVDGRPAGPEALREGAEVRASYRKGGGRPTAVTIDARTRRDPAARPEAAPEGGGASWGTSPEPAPDHGG